MAGNTFGEVFRVTTFGESHGAGLGCVIDGCPAGLPITREEIQRELDRRRPGQSAVTTPRDEKDGVEILSGVFEGVTTGAPIALVTMNGDQRSRDYGAIKEAFRPGHADFGFFAKFGVRDYRGGGRSSGRETWARVAAGAVAGKLLMQGGVSVRAWADEVGGVAGETVDEEYIEQNVVRSACRAKAGEMERVILAVREAGDSVGGVVRVVIRGVPAGWGEPVFDKVDALLAHGLMSIGTVKGVEVGDGFAVARMRGSECNDGFRGVSSEGGQVRAEKATNHAGGILGGITDGGEIVLRAAVKPTSSISLAQETVNVRGEGVTIQVEGRHDPCIVPRVIPVMEGMCRLVLADLMLRARGDRVSG